MHKKHGWVMGCHLGLMIVLSLDNVEERESGGGYRGKVGGRGFQLINEVSHVVSKLVF